MRSEARSIRRLPAGSVPAAWLHHSWTLIGLIAAAILYGTHSDLWPGRWAWIPIGALLVLRLGHPVLIWATLRYELFDDRIVVRTGILWRHVRTTPWSSLSAVDVDRPWSYRMFGLAVVSVHAGGEDASAVTLPGIDLSTAERLGEEVGPGAAGEDSRPARSDLVVYRASAAELLISSGSRGRFLVIGVGIAAAAADLLDTFGLWTPTLSVAGLAPTAFAAITAVAIVAAGLLLSVARFRGFVIRRAGDRLTFSYGWLSRRERILDFRAVVGTRVERNLLEMVFDRVRVSLHSVDTAQRISSNLILPSLPRPVVAHTLAAHLPELASTSSFLACPGRGSLPRALAVAGALGGLGAAAAIAAATLAALPVGAAVLVGATVLLAVGGCARLGAARLRVDGTRLVRSSRLVADREDVVRLAAVHAIGSVGTRSHRALLVRAHYFAGIPRALTALVRDPDFTVRASGHMTQQSTSAAASADRTEGVVA